MASVVGFVAPGVTGVVAHFVLVALALWSCYRIITRTTSLTMQLADAAAAIGISVAIPLLVAPTDLLNSTTVPQAVMTVTVATVLFQAPLTVGGPVVLLIVGVYAVRCADVIGWSGVARINDVYAAVAAALAALAARAAVRRAAAAADLVHSERVAAEIDEGVASARRNYEREQLSLLHDTAAATLILVGQQIPVPEERLAARARRDLEVLRTRARIPPTTPTDVVPELRTAAHHLGVPVEFRGRTQLWLDGQLAAAVGAAAREALNNVDRHACAQFVSITVGPSSIEITDDGVGFDASLHYSGHGISESIVARMSRVGGAAVIESNAGLGTVVRVSFGAISDREPNAAAMNDATTRLMKRFGVMYGCALVVCALAYLMLTVPWGSHLTRWHVLHTVLPLAAGACALSALPAIFTGRFQIAWPVTAALATIVAVQQGFSSVAELHTEADWSLPAVGFCLLPHMLQWSFRRAATVLVSLWLVAGAASVIRDPSAAMTSYIGLTVGLYLLPQLAIADFNHQWRKATVNIQAQHDHWLHVVASEAVAEALQAEHLQRYAQIVDRLIPLLTSISEARTITDTIRQQSRRESQRLRMLFDESRSNNHGLLARIQDLVEAADVRGLGVSVHLDPKMPTVSALTTQRLLDVLESSLEQAQGRARVVLTHAGAQVELSVVCCASGARRMPFPDDADVRVVSSEDRLWITAHFAYDPDGVA